MLYLRSPFFTMNRILRIVVYPEVLLKSNCRRFSGSIGNNPKVKIVSDQFSDNMRISFKYGTVQHSMLNVVVSKQEQLQTVLSKIKDAISLLRKKEELRLSVLSKYSVEAVAESLLDDSELLEDVDVSLIHNDQLLESSVPSIEAWTPGSFLKIGRHVYEVHQNTPTVVALSLPKTIIAACVIRPHFIFEHADVHESKFVWYHSASAEEVEALKITESENTLKLNEQWWIKVHEGFVYRTSRNDIGRRLCLMCTPVHGKQIGQEFAAESTGVVHCGPESFPFEERHLYTKELTDTESIRCLSYNILANIYVETKKFPYCSKVAKDVYYRKQLLLRELEGYNSDILCLQEVQGRIFEFDLLPILQSAGFDGCYMKKGGRRHEGLGCFFRTQKFKVISKEGILLNDVLKKKDVCDDLLPKVAGNLKDMSKLLAQDSALQIVLLEHADNPKRRILVANTHLYSNKNMPEVRLLQSALCVCYIEHILKMQDAAEPTGLLFCGDFNSLPHSSVLQFLLQGSYECCSSWNKTLKTAGVVVELNGGHLPSTSTNCASESSADTTLRHNLSLDTACGFPTYTNYTEEFSGCLDYIFYNKNCFSVSEIVPFPSHELVTQNVALPSELFPSDHIPIICTLKWK